MKSKLKISLAMSDRDVFDELQKVHAETGIAIYRIVDIALSQYLKTFKRKKK